MPRKPRIDLREAWEAVDYLATVGAFRNEREVWRVKTRIGREARRRATVRRKRAEEPAAVGLS